MSIRSKYERTVGVRLQTSFYHQEQADHRGMVTLRTATELTRAAEEAERRLAEKAASKVRWIPRRQ